MKILASGENYLETILILQKTKGNVRAVDIVDELGYTKSSVSRGVNILKNKGYIIIDNNGVINFTEKGMTYAQNIFERHNVLTNYFVSLGVDKKIAETDACKIEHVISKETFEAIKKNN